MARRLLQLLACVAALALSTGADARRPQPSPTEAPCVSLVDIACSTDSLSVLCAAIGAAGLNDLPVGLTLFAPTNAAFLALAAELGVPPAELLKLKNLEAVLLYHVLPGVFFAADFEDGELIETVQGCPVKIGVSRSGGVTVNQANVVLADIEGCEGVAHVIDSVLLPPKKSCGATESPTKAPTDFATTDSPTKAPPSPALTDSPTKAPPSPALTDSPTKRPTRHPTKRPTKAPMPPPRPTKRPTKRPAPKPPTKRPSPPTKRPSPPTKRPSPSPHRGGGWGADHMARAKEMAAGGRWGWGR